MEKAVGKSTPQVKEGQRSAKASEEFGAILVVVSIICFLLKAVLPHLGVQTSFWLIGAANFFSWVFLWTGVGAMIGSALDKNKE